MRGGVEGDGGVRRGDADEDLGVPRGDAGRRSCWARRNGFSESARREEYIARSQTRDRQECLPHRGEGIDLRSITVEGGCAT